MHIRYALPLSALAILGSAPLAVAADMQASAVLIKLIEQVEVPAREAGVLEKVAVREGQMVKNGELLAQVEDRDLQLEKRHAELELAGARKQAESDVKVRFSKKAAEVADAELRRAVDSEKRFAKSVSANELDHLRLEAQKSALEVEAAQLEFELAQVTRELKENDLQIAEHGIQQRRITAPLAGFVAQVNRHNGEWVQPGQPILRLLRLDRLRAEGLVSAQVVTGDLMGRRVRLVVKLDDKPHDFSGKIDFVSPEIDPVNGQVRIWAEIENTDLLLRPGLHGSLTIEDSPPVAARR